MTENRRLETVAHFEGKLGSLSEADLSRPKYELYQDRMEIYDPVWEKETLESPVLLALANSDALRRLQTVEQLTLPDSYKTIPGSTHFSRWEHAWGATIFSGRLADEMGLSSEEKLDMQLKALLSDVCHTAHSHAGDWILQGKGGPENFHDNRLQDYSEVVGISEILRRYGHEPKRLLIQEQDGIIDAKIPYLDVDRVDYTLRESYRWVDQIPGYRSTLNKDSFTIKNGMLVVKNMDAAKLLGVSYILLVSEHWQEPAHRLQLELFMESIKRVFVARQSQENELGSYSPIDLMMTSDDVLARVASEHDDYMPMLKDLMRGVSGAEVDNRWRARADRARVALSTILSGNGADIGWVGARYDQLPRSYEIQPSEDSNLRNSRNAHVINLEKLRLRHIDPPFIDQDGEVQVLSEVDPKFMDYKEQAIGNVQRNWRAAIIGNEASTLALRQCMRENEEAWPHVMSRQRMPNSLLREQLRETVRASNGTASKFVDFTDHRR